MIDSQKQKDEFEKDPKAYLDYRRGIEQEINVRFRFVSIFLILLTFTLVFTHLSIFYNKKGHQR